jgi:hypothetical protein
MTAPHPFIKLVFIWLILVSLFSFSAWGVASSINVWGYCTGPLCLGNVFERTCTNIDTCSQAFNASLYCQYEGPYYFDARSVCTYGGTTEVGVFGPVFNVSWDANQANCECYLGDYLTKGWLPAQVPSQGNCCGDDVNERYCGANLTACFNGSITNDGDIDPFVCNCLSGLGDCDNGEQVCWAPSVQQCCGDDGELDNFAIGTSACLNGTYLTNVDGSQEACLLIGALWNISGEVDPQSCCGDDINEYNGTKKGADTMSIRIDWLSLTGFPEDDACCNAATDCVSNNTCYSVGQAAFDLDPLGSIDNIAECGSDGKWFDLDGDSASCIEHGLEWIEANGVGEYDLDINGGDGITECCGDDLNENAQMKQSAPDSSMPGNPLDKGCCPDQTDCVKDGYCNVSTTIFGEGFNRVVCEDGVWGGGDDSGLRCTELDAQNIWDEQLNFESGLNGACCGDDDGEYLNTKECLVDVCDSNPSDGACCNSDSDCVVDGNCYTYFEDSKCGGAGGSCADVGDESPDLEVCMSYGWQDADNSVSSEACEELDGHTNPTLYMPAGVNPVCGLWEKGEGNCNDLTPDTDPSITGFCCGDDPGEVVREGFDNVCFREDTGCYVEDEFGIGSYFEEGEYVGDSYCENGVVTSRTKLIAVQLMQIANLTSPDDYTLFCDDYQNSLNYYQYPITWATAEMYLTDLTGRYVNNICVLQTPDGVVFGTSLNQPLYNDNLQFMDVLYDLDGTIDCTSATETQDGQFHKCGTSDKVWYNNETKSIIFSDFSLNIGQLNYWDRFLLFLKNPFENIFNTLMDLITTRKSANPSDYEFISSTTKFSRLYVSRKDVLSIKGVTEDVTGEGEYLSVAYNCYNSDVCRTINKSLESLGTGMGVCHYDPASEQYYFASESPEAMPLWPQLTAQLRPRESTTIPVRACDSSQSCAIRPITCGFGEKAIFALYDKSNSHARMLPSTLSFNYLVCCPDDYALDPTTPLGCNQGGVVSLSSVQDAHADAYKQGTFTNNVCMKAASVGKKASCTYRANGAGCRSDEVCVVSLSDITNAHVSGCDSPFDTRICCKIT